MLFRCSECETVLEVREGETAYQQCPNCASSLSSNSPEMDVLRAGDQIAHFKLQDLLGKGTHGVVWKAWDTELQRPVALKIPRREAFDTEQLLREARSAAGIKHPSIVDVYEVGLSAVQPYIATEFIEGENLERWLLKHEAEPHRMAEIVQQLAAAVHSAHEAGVIHRDLKPTNVMLDADERVHITDFGIAKRDDSEFTLTIEGQVIGTPAYMSPEQARGEGMTADRRTDVYSLGAILYRLLAGRPPFKGSSHVVIPLVLSQPPVALDESIPEPLRLICEKAMAKSADERYDTAEQLAHDLRQFQLGNELTVSPPQPTKEGKYAKLNGLVGRRPVLSVFTSIVGVLAVAGLSSWLSPAASGERLIPDRELQTVLLKADSTLDRIHCIPVLGKTCRVDTDRKIVKRENLSTTEVTLDLAPGCYLVIASDKDQTLFHEVIRTVPRPGMKPGDFKHLNWVVTEEETIELPLITLHSTSDLSEPLLEVPGGTCLFGEAGEKSFNTQFQATIDAYLLGVQEVSEQHFEAWRDQGSDRHKQSQRLSYRPIVNVTIDEILAFLEDQGLRLPTELEYEFAATDGGKSTEDKTYNAGIFRPTAAGQMVKNQYGNLRLFGGVAEVTWSTAHNSWIELHDPDLAAVMQNWSVRGVHSDYHNITGLRCTAPRHRASLPAEYINNEHIGFRAARSLRPRWDWDVKKDPLDKQELAERND